MHGMHEHGTEGKGKMGMMGMKCRCPHHMATAIFAILLGLTFLLQAFDVLSASAVSYIWPSILILAGLSKMCGGMCSCCNSCGSTCETGSDTTGCGCSGEGCSDGHCATDKK